MTPVRIQLSRKKGFNLQRVSRNLNGLPAVKVDRSTKWGNPFITGEIGLAVALFRRMLIRNGYWSPIPVNRWPRGKMPTQWTSLNDVRKELRGKNLACWCKLCSSHADGKPVGVTCRECEPCHADVLLELANK